MFLARSILDLQPDAVLEGLMEIIVISFLVIFWSLPAVCRYNTYAWFC